MRKIRHKIALHAPKSPKKHYKPKLRKVDDYITAKTIAAFEARPYGEVEALAELVGGGMTLHEAGANLHIPVTLTMLYAEAPTFKLRVRQIKKSATGGYALECDAILEAERINNINTRIAIRDDLAQKAADRLKAADGLDLMAPSVRNKMKEDNTIKIIFSADERRPMIEGLAHARGVSIETIEAEFFSAPKALPTPEEEPEDDEATTAILDSPGDSQPEGSQEYPDPTSGQ